MVRATWTRPNVGGGGNLLWRFELWRSCTGYRNTTKIRYNSTGYCVKYCNWKLWYPKPQIWAQWTACACCRATDVDLHVQVLLVPQQIYRRYRTPKNSRQRRTFDSLKLDCSLLLWAVNSAINTFRVLRAPKFWGCQLQGMDRQKIGTGVMFYHILPRPRAGIPYLPREFTSIA